MTNLLFETTNSPTVKAFDSILMHIKQDVRTTLYFIFLLFWYPDNWSTKT